MATPKRVLFVRASLETRNFTFEAYGTNIAEAKKALVTVLETHADQYGLRARWWAEEYGTDYDLTMLETGMGYRDGQQVIPPSTKEIA